MRTPDDLAGMRIRVLPSRIQARTFELLGAVPLRLDLTEAIEGIKAGTLDVYGKRIRELALQGSVDAAGWRAKVQAVELAGDLSYRRADGGLLEADLAHLTVPGDTPGTTAPLTATSRYCLPFNM